MKKVIIFLFLVLILAGAGFYFQNDILKIYNSASKNFVKSAGDVADNFKKTDVGSFISQAKKEFLNPPPLNIGRAENDAVFLKSKTIEETNLQRKTNGLPELSENSKLGEAAGAKANDMFLHQYFEHTSPSGLTSGQLVQSSGYEYIVAGENLILGNFSSEKEIVEDWMQSPGHRANILNNRYTEIGAAVVKGTYGGRTVWIAVQEFGLPLSICPQPSAEIKASVEFYKIQMDSMSAEIDAKRKEINNLSPMSFQYNTLVSEYNQMVNEYNLIASEAKKLTLQYNNQVSAFNTCVAGK